VNVAGIPLGVVAGEIVPHCAAEQNTLHVTPLLLVSLLTAPVTRAVDPAGTVAVPGETDTAIAGGGEEEVEEPPPPHPNAPKTTAVPASTSTNRMKHLGDIKAHYFAMAIVLFLATGRSATRNLLNGHRQSR
jgi:hypothetical protein